VKNEDIFHSSKITKAAGLVMIAFVISNLTGLLRQILVSKAFGTGMEIEAFNAANRVSETIFNLVAGGALASAFIPTFTGLLTKKEDLAAWKLASSIFNLLMMVVTITILAAALFSPSIVRYILAPGFVDDPLKTKLTEELLLIMLPSALFFSFSGLTMGVLNSHHIFFLPALAPSMYQVGMIFGLLVLSPSMGIYGLAWGVVIGSVLHLVLQIPILLKQKGKFYFHLGVSDPYVREVGRLMLPRLLGVAVVQINFWINIRIASHQPEGSVTGLVLAFALMLMPQAAIAQSIATAVLPTLSAQYSIGRLDDLRTTLVASLRNVLFLSLPAAFGLIMLRKPIIIFLYQRGEFTSHSTEIVAWALLWYAAGLVGHCVVEILVRAFYAMHDTKTPVLIGTVAMGLNIAFSYLFSSWFVKLGWLPHGGLALANSLATALEMCGLFYIMRLRIGGLQGKLVARVALKALVASLIMAFTLFLWLGQDFIRAYWQLLFGGIFIGVVTYGICSYFLKVPELRLSMLRNFFRRNTS
jgi:putative peptidoglycan lipid II flippase